MTRSRQWLVLSVLLMALGGLVFAFKVVRLGFPVFPDQTSEQWVIQARLEIEPVKGPVRASMLLPVRSTGFTISNESFVSRDFGLTVQEEMFRRRADWAIRSLDGDRALYYRATVIKDMRQHRFANRPDIPSAPQLDEPWASALEDLVEVVKEESADVQSFTAEVLDHLHESPDDASWKLFLETVESPLDHARLAQTVLAAEQIPSKLVHGIMLKNDVQRAAVHTMLAVWDGDDWLLFDPVTGQQGRPEEFMIWWRGLETLASVSGALINDLQISVKKRMTSSLELASLRTELKDSFIGRISLLHLPVQTQSVYEVLLLVPFGILVIVLLRNFVGLSSFGTFAPVLIALAFRETELFKGILLFMLIVSLGLVFRFYLERLRLLLVPRLAAVVTIVVLLMTAISLLSDRLGTDTGLSVSLFPMVIISMVIERMSIVWEERGAATSIREGLGSLFMASLAYMVISIDVLEYWVTVYPEVNLIVLGLIVALGRYTGFRLTELFRFRQLSATDS